MDEHVTSEEDCGIGITRYYGMETRVDGELAGVLPAVPVARNLRGGARPFSIQSASSASKGITKCNASISLRTRSMSSSFCLRTWNKSFMSAPAVASVRQISGLRREGRLSIAD